MKKARHPRFHMLPIFLIVLLVKFNCVYALAETTFVPIPNVQEKASVGQGKEYLKRHKIDSSKLSDADFLSPIAYHDLLLPTNDEPKPKRKEIPIGTNPVDVDGFVMRRATPFLIPELPPMEARFMGSKLDWSGDGGKLFVNVGDKACIRYPDLKLLAVAVASMSESPNMASFDVLTTVATSKLERFVKVQNHLGVLCVDLIQSKQRQIDGYRLKMRRIERVAMSPHGNILLINESRKLHVFEVSEGVKKLRTIDVPSEVKEAFLVNSLITTSPDGKIGMWLFRTYDATQDKPIPAKLLLFSTGDPSKSVIEIELEFPAFCVAYSPHHRLFFVSGEDGSFWKIDPATKQARSMELLGAPTRIYEIDVNPSRKCVACLGKDRLIFIE